MQHRILSAAAAQLGAAAAATPAAPLVIAPPAAAAPAPAPAAPAAPAADGTVDVVTVADAQAAIATARTEGATAERERTAAVFASDSGKTNPAMAAFMLNANPGATAASIIAHMGTLPAPAAAAAPATPAAAAPAAPAAPAPAAPAAAAPALTTPLSETPLIAAGGSVNNGAPGDDAAATAKLWDQGIAAAAANFGGSTGADLAPGIPRTGN